ncbi:hypothetical protein CYMTET_25571 [Cymbomonas tetramitiformis]|uniref:Uncharacterized protein n=1 Tax=Cymbomonas tetramitiformis TaxID=36881 RepID=A0AAE0FU96_9CHLO|nr:hypothetical protein CYMTET_25571 [Cymbomonas tetramitiformis]
MGGGGGSRGNRRAEGQAQGQLGVRELMRDPEVLGEAGRTWLRGLSVGERAVGDYPSLMVPKKVWGLFTMQVCDGRTREDPDEHGGRRGVHTVLFAPAPGEEMLWKLERLHPPGTSRRQDVGRDRRRELQKQSLELDEKTFNDVMHNVPRASGPADGSQWRWEHLWAVHVPGGQDALLEVCNHRIWPPGRAPAGVREWLASARLVALLKDDLSVNVRPMWEVPRKLVAKIIWSQPNRGPAPTDKWEGTHRQQTTDKHANR